MKLIIDIPDGYKDNYKVVHNGSIRARMILNAVSNGTPLSEDATNGDVIKALFPYISIEDNCQKYYSVNIENLSEDRSFNTVGFRKDWWNAPYKVGETE